MAKELSIILPSLRIKELIACIKSVGRFTGDIDYELIVITPMETIPSAPNTTHIKENKAEGIYRAVNKGFAQVKGEYVTLLCDENRVLPCWAINMLTFMRQYDDCLVQGNFRILTCRGENPSIEQYGKLIAPFFCIKTEMAHRVGGFMGCALKGFWGDNDLSMRVWHHGGFVMTCPDAWVYYKNKLDAGYKKRRDNYLQVDTDTFVSRWFPIYGRNNIDPMELVPLRGENNLPVEIRRHIPKSHLLKYKLSRLLSAFEKTPPGKLLLKLLPAKVKGCLSSIILRYLE